MVRPRKKRCVIFNPEIVYFKPRGIPLRDLQEVSVYMDEIEAIRLADILGLQHEEAGKRMHVSRPTFGRIIQQARSKIADAIINGKAIRIEKNITERIKMMIYILIVSSQKDRFANFITFFEEKNINIGLAESGERAFSMISDKAFHMVIVDEFINDTTGLEFIKKLIRINPLINSALVSSLSAEDFHESTEGLGILMQLPSIFNKDNAEKLIKQLKVVLNMEYEL